MITIMMYFECLSCRVEKWNLCFCVYNEKHVLWSLWKLIEMLTGSRKTVIYHHITVYRHPVILLYTNGVFLSVKIGGVYFCIPLYSSHEVCGKPALENQISRAQLRERKTPLVRRIHAWASLRLGWKLRCARRWACPRRSGGSRDVRHPGATSGLDAKQTS